MANQMEANRTETVNGETLTTMAVPVTPDDVVALNYETALASYSPEERQEILDLSQSIDVLRIDNVMHYGDAALKATFEQCGNFLKDERGSQADQEVINQVIQLAKKAGDNYEDFNLALKEPNFFQKVYLKLTANGKASQTERIQNSAITNYTLLTELKNSCESWLVMLEEAMGVVIDSAFSDVENASLLEKYIIAGKLAEERIGKELVAIHEQYQQTGMQKYALSYEEMKEGYDIFTIKLNNLEKSRVMYCLSLGQLGLIKRSNMDVQISIRTQMQNSMTLIGQQLRNAVLNAKTREVLDGQKAISRLNDEIIRDLSKSIGITAGQAEKLIYASFYDVEAARAAITTVIDSCKAIRSTAEEMLPKMKADVTELNKLIKELEPHVDSVQILNGEAPTNVSAETASNTKLSF